MNSGLPSDVAFGASEALTGYVSTGEVSHDGSVLMAWSHSVATDWVWQWWLVLFLV